MPEKDGYFTKKDLNEFGYPKKLIEKAEHHYWNPGDGEKAAIRNWNSGLNLNLVREPSIVNDRLGVRRAKIFFINKIKRKSGVQNGIYR